MTTFSFPKSKRLLKRYQFVSLQNRGQQFFGAFFVITWKKNKEKQARLGITTPKKCGDAYERNRFRRLVREAFRLQGTLEISCDLAVFPKKNFREATLKALMEDFQRFFHLSSS